VLPRLPTVEQVVVVPYGHAQPDVTGIAGARLWDDVLATSDALEVRFEQLPFDHPLYVLYSSGTTGLPKCIVHTAWGIVPHLLKEHVLHTGLQRTDRLFFFTTTSWMMWNWLVSALAVGCEVLLYDGSPLASPGILFDFAERERMTVMGISPRYL